MENRASEREKEVSSSFSESGFQDYLTDTLNKGTLAIMLSIGHRTKLFDIISSLGIQEGKIKCKLDEFHKQRLFLTWNDDAIDTFD